MLDDQGAPGHPNKTIAFVLLASLAWSAGASGVEAQQAKEGEAAITHTFTYTDRALKMGERTAIQRELVGSQRMIKELACSMGSASDA